MTKEDFEVILLERVKKIGELCRIKGAQYAGTEDRLHNFKSVATQLNCTPERALLGMVIKQWTWILDRIKDLEVDRAFEEPVMDSYSLAEWDERIGDVIVYMILLEALRHEAYSRKSSKKDSKNEKRDKISKRAG